MNDKPMVAKVNVAPLKIVGDGARWDVQKVQGRGVPVLIIDARGREDIRDLFILHHDLDKYGEASHQWLTGHGPAILGRRPRPPVLLRVNYLHPVSTQIDIEFSLPEQALLVEMVLRAECFYLQPGKPGDSSVNDTPRILIEALSVGFEPVWRNMHLALIEGQLKEDKGIRRSRRRALAKEVVEKTVEICESRLA